MRRSTREYPILRRALEILREPEFSNIQITNIVISDVRIAIAFTVPETEDLTPAALHAKLNQRYGPNIWTGAWGTIQRGRRPYEVSWIDPGGKR